jgi:putative glycosyltransferase (TIGR04348 family)
MRTPAARRPRVVIITPRSAASNAGNWHTAARWARFLRARYRVIVTDRWDGLEPDCLIALHARRSADTIAAFAAAHPDTPLVVVLTGTDLYRDIASDRSAQRSLELATRLVVLNELGARRLPRRMRAKCSVILQSAPPLRLGTRSARTLTIAVVGHLRAEKDPQLVWEMLAHIDPTIPLRVLHAGAAYDAALGRKAATVAQRDPRYRWLGNVTRPVARQLMRRAHLLLHPSVMEGGAQVVIEAVTAHTAVIGSRIDGNAGLLGRDYPGWFKVGDAKGAARLIERAARDPAFLRRLQSRCAQRARLFAPAREAAAVNKLVDNALQARNRKSR